MVLNINDDYQIKSDEYQFVLYSLSHIKDGTRVERPSPRVLGYYGSVSGALSSIFLQYEIKKEDELDIKGLLEVIKSFEKQLENLN